MKRKTKIIAVLALDFILALACFVVWWMYSTAE